MKKKLYIQISHKDPKKQKVAVEAMKGLIKEFGKAVGEKVEIEELEKEGK